MTEGIIQKVMYKYFPHIHSDVYFRLEQELIAEIKKTIDYHNGCWHIQKGCSLLTELIGDTE
jgi:hypothetical protein